VLLVPVLLVLVMLMSFVESVWAAHVRTPRRGRP